jgi:hypothetical protein
VKLNSDPWLVKKLFTDVADEKEAGGEREMGALCRNYRGL